VATTTAPIAIPYLPKPNLFGRGGIWSGRLVTAGLCGRTEPRVGRRVPTLPSGYRPLKHALEDGSNRNRSDILTFTWRYIGSDGEDRGTSDQFPDRESAEAWIGDSWSDLLERGVEEVALEEDGSVAYRMGLRPSS
jgi:hypothetical protein